MRPVESFASAPVPSSKRQWAMRDSETSGGSSDSVTCSPPLLKIFPFRVAETFVRSVAGSAASTGLLMVRKLSALSDQSTALLFAFAR